MQSLTHKQVQTQNKTTNKQKTESENVLTQVSGLLSATWHLSPVPKQKLITPRATPCFHHGPEQRAKGYVEENAHTRQQNHSAKAQTLMQIKGCLLDS